MQLWLVQLWVNVWHYSEHNFAVGTPCQTCAISLSDCYLQSWFIWWSWRVGEGDILENDPSLQLLRSQLSRLLTLWCPVEITEHFGDDANCGHRLSVAIQNLLWKKEIICIIYFSTQIHRKKIHQCKIFVSRLTFKLFDIGFWYKKKETRLPMLRWPEEMRLRACTSMSNLIPRLTSCMREYRERNYSHCSKNIPNNRNHTGS